MIGISHGAISVINAIPCGIGSTIGVSLQTKAEFTEWDTTEIDIINGKGMNDSLVRLCVKRTMEAIGISTDTPYKLTIESQIPPSRGLKSSSSVCNAVIRSVLNTYHESMDDLDILNIGVQCAKEARVTITGAFDDACGCNFGGLVFTDNTNNILLERRNIPNYDVVLWIPEKKIPKNKVSIDAYRLHKAEFEEALELAHDDPLSALTMNGRLVAEIINADTSIIDLALSNGALAAGISGTGPAISVVTELGKGNRMAELIGGKTILTQTRVG